MTLDINQLRVPIFEYTNVIPKINIPFGNIVECDMNIWTEYFHRCSLDLSTPTEMGYIESLVENENSAKQTRKTVL